VTGDRPVTTSLTDSASPTDSGIIRNEVIPAGVTGPAAAARGGSTAVGRLARMRGSSPRRELTLILLLGAIGAGLVFLAMHQSWAQVRTAVPAPLPTSVVKDSGQDLIPYGEALAIAALASLAAVLATRRLARRIVGVLLAALGLAIIGAVTTGVTVSAALSAAAQNISPATGSGAGDTAGSATGGSISGASAVPNVAGFHSHAVLTAMGWQAMAVIGALAVVAAGVLVVWRAGRLPVMSSRYDAPVRGGPAPAPAPAPSGEAADGEEPDGSDSASMWESLSRGEDPTSARRHG
jgi:uncharacterized membrane protein (TIGR02234 family)